MRGTFDLRYRSKWTPDTDGAAPPWAMAQGLTGDGSELRVPFGIGESVEMEWRAVAPDGTVSVWARLPDQLVDTRGAVLFGLPRVAWVDCTQVLRWKYDEEPPALAGWIVRTAEGNYPWFGYARPCHDGVLRTPWFILHGIPKGPRTFWIAPVDTLGNVGEPLRLVVEVGVYDDQEAVVVEQVQHGPSASPGAYPGTIVEGAHNAGLLALVGMNPGTVYQGESRPFYSGNPSAAVYGGNHGDVVYEVQFTPTADPDLLVSFLTVQPVVDPPAGWFTEVRHGTRPFYKGRPDGEVYSDDPNGRLYEEAPFGEWVYKGGAGTVNRLYSGIPTKRFYKSAERRPWPGRLSALARMPYEIRVTVPGSRWSGDRATLSSLRFTVSKGAEYATAAELAAGLALKHSTATALGGDLLGTLPNPSVVGVHFGAGQKLFSATPPLEGQELAQVGGVLAGRDAWLTKKKTVDQTSIGDTATDLNDLTVAVQAGKTLRFRAYLVYTTDDLTTGGMFSVNGPAASAVAFSVKEWISTTGVANATHETLDEFAARTAGPGATEAVAVVEGRITFSSNGTFAVRAKAEATLTMAVLAGSWIEYYLTD